MIFCYLRNRILLFFLSLMPTLIFADPTVFVVGQPLPKWAPHYLDIDHLNEGGGNATFMIFPDGTTLLYDMGDAQTGYEKMGRLPLYSQEASAKDPAYTWVADFIKQVSPHADQINYAVISHFHFDHFG